MSISRPTTAKSLRGRPLAAKTLAIRDAVVALASQYEVMTVRGIFYALTVLGVVPKSEGQGYRPVQRQVLEMRRAGLLPWGFVSDATRWVRKPESFDSVDDAIRELQRTYRRNLWRTQSRRIEVWLEKDALAGVVIAATEPWDVRLMVSRGTSSATFLHAAGAEASEAWRHGFTTFIFTLYDFDAAGERAARTVERGFQEFAPDAPVVVSRLAVQPWQIELWDLPTRPAKVSDPEAAKFGADAVELDAIPPDQLVSLVEDAIVELVDEDAWLREQAAEESERQILARMAGVA